MASLFRPPESARPNPKAPKLTLPPIHKEQTGTSTSPNNNNKNIYLTLNSKTSNTSIESANTLSSNSTFQKSPLNTSYSDATLIAQPPYSASSITSTNSSTRTLKKRPIPPPIPPLVMSMSMPNKTTPVSPNGVSAMANTLTRIRLGNDPEALHDMENNQTPTINKPITNSTVNSASKDLYLRKDLAASTESYPSALLSAYDQGSSANTSPVKSAGPLSATLLNAKDVDQLDEDQWNISNLKNNIVTLGMLGEGAFGSVAKCRLKSGSKIFALKTINTLNTDPDYQKQIFRELQFNKSFKSDYIVRYYGMFTDEQNSSIYIAMEYMGGRSLDAIYKNLLNLGGRISEKILGKIAESVLRGLSYLHERKVIHRDIKPQNILLNEQGQVKLCDFGVSGEAVNSLATTFTGTSFYMAPERIQGQPYSVTCDVWSLGLTLLEVAQARFPFGSDKMTANIAPIELLMVILTFTPELKDEPENNIVWSSSFKSFIEYCLKKEPRERPSPRQMIQHPWIQGQMKKKVNMEKFIKKCWAEER